MSENKNNAYDVDAHIPELYDRHETQREDVALLGRLLAGRGPLRILEPFCGNGRLLIPLAQAGHELVGLDQSAVMLDSARAKLANLAAEVRGRITLRQADVTASHWPGSFDVALLGANCLYELASPDEQERCIRFAAAALRPGGFVYVDNNHIEGPLPEDWYPKGPQRGPFPAGLCADGTNFDTTTEVLWADPPKRLVRWNITVTITTPEGTVSKRQCERQKHPVSQVEVRTWLERQGFAIEQLYGDRAGHPYTETSPRAIFWARQKP